MDIKLPGLNTGNFHFHVPGGDIHITGKWFNYGIIFIVMILDLNMWKNQIFYEPFVYGQYTDNEDYIYTVSDREFLANATKETLSYAWRWTNVNPVTNKTYGLEDHKMNSRYIGVPLSVKGTAFIPSLLAFALFGILIKYFSKGGPPTKVAPVEGNTTNDDTDGTRDSKNEDNTVINDPRISMSHQSLSSSKSEFATNKTKHFDSFLSVDSSRVGRQASGDNLDSEFGSSDDVLGGSGDVLRRSLNNLENSGDALRRSGDGLEKSLHELRNSVGSGGEGSGSMEQHTLSRPAWAAETPIIALQPKKRTRGDSCVSEKANESGKDSNNDEYHETMVQDLVQELSSLNFDEGESQIKEDVPPTENNVSANGNKARVLSFRGLFRQDTRASVGSQSQLSIAASNDENGYSDAKPVTPSRNNFLD